MEIKAVRRFRGCLVPAKAGVKAVYVLKDGHFFWPQRGYESDPPVKLFKSKKAAEKFMMEVEK